ncbi:MAG: hypothetical protein ACTSWL_10405 [Promethearchaeota archaeon]
MKEEFSKEELQKIKKDIDNMSHFEMAYLIRFSQAGDIYFRSDIPEISEYFAKQFKALGGMTSVISKEVGW